MIDALIGALMRVGHWGYVLIFLGAALESAAFLGFLVPGETLVIAAGVMVALGVLDWPQLMVAVALGAIVGDSVSYELGRHFGRAWLLRHGRKVGLDETRLARVERFYARYGGAAIVGGRFVGFLRPLVPFVAGAARMTYPRFLWCNVVGGVLWAVVTVLLGYFLGESWALVERWIGRTALVAGAVVALVVILGWLRRRARAARARRSALAVAVASGSIVNDGDRKRTGEDPGDGIRPPHA